MYSFILKNFASLFYIRSKTVKGRFVSELESCAKCPRALTRFPYPIISTIKVENEQMVGI
jgi:hypothetical protein